MTLGLSSFPSQIQRRHRLILRTVKSCGLNYFKTNWMAVQSLVLPLLSASLLLMYSWSRNQLLIANI